MPVTGVPSVQKPAQYIVQEERTLRPRMAMVHAVGRHHWIRKERDSAAASRNRTSYGKDGDFEGNKYNQ